MSRSACERSQVLHDYEARLLFRLIVPWRRPIWRLPMAAVAHHSRRMTVAARRKLYLMKNR